MAFAYYRVSTAAQGEAGTFGLPAQREAVERYAKDHGFAIERTFEDIGFSGATAERPGLFALLDAAKSGLADVVIVAKWDRLARDAMLDGHLRYRLKQSGVRVVSATETNGIDPISEMTQTILAAVAQYERHLIAARLANARKVKKAAGGYAGGQPPYGWRARGDGTLEPIPDEQKWLRWMLDARGSGATFASIAADLTQLGAPARKGGVWRSSSVHQIVSESAGRPSCR